MDVTVKTDAGDLFRGIGSKPRVRQGLEVLKRRDRRHRSTPHGCGRCFFFLIAGSCQFLLEIARL